MTLMTLRSEALTAVTTAVIDWDINSGGEVVAAKGLPEVRVWPKVLIISTGPVVRESAVLIAEASRGEPWEIVRLACGTREDDGRIKAVTF